MNPITMLLQDNWHIFRDINSLAGHHPLVDALMVFSANDLIVALPLLLLGFWFLFARWSPLMRRAATQGTPQDEAGRRLGQRMALLGCGAVVLALAFNLALGQLFYEPRPFVSHPTADHLLISHTADASFPSDHEAVAGAVAAILVLYILLALGEWVRTVRRTPTETAAHELRILGVPILVTSAAVLAACIIGFARVYVGVHYPLDIVGGLGCGVFAALLVTLVSPLLTPLLNTLIRIADRLRLA